MTTTCEQPELWDIDEQRWSTCRPGATTVDVEAWIAEARNQRQQQYDTHRLLVGAELRQELQTVRALGKAQRHAERLRRAALPKDEK